MSENRLSVENLVKTFATDQGDVQAVADINFQVEDNQFFTMLGPSGCGKTTTLRMIAGLEQVTSGHIRFGLQDFTELPVSSRNIGMVFQSYALYPHLSVFENVAYGLRIRKRPDSEVRAQVSAMLKLLELEGLATRFSVDLSGGQQQRVSIARALVYDPNLLLLDEPLANLDAQLRVQMREEIRRIQKEVGIITIYVTHDQEEAMAISDQLAVFNLGRLLQVGPPAEVYYTPRSLFVADFIGKANFFKVRGLEQRGDATAVTLDDGSQLIAARAYQLGADEQQRVPAGLAALLMVRPQHLSLAPPDVTGVAGTVRRIQFLGGSVRYVVECPVATQEVIVDMPEYVPGVEEGSGAHIVINPIRSCAFHL